MNRFRAFVLLAGFAAMTVPLMPLQWLFLKTSPGMAKAFPHHFHRWLAKLLGIRIAVHGTPPDGAALIASNHVSWLDIVVLSAAAPVSFVAKREVGGWPFFGSLARLQRTVFVERERRLPTKISNDTIKERLATGDAIVLFAEGTSYDGFSILPFKSAFFAAAEDLPVVPCTLAYSGHRNLPMTRRLAPFYAWYGDMELPPHLWEAVGMGPIEVDVIFHPPRSLAAEGDRKALAKACEDDVRRGLAAALHRREELRDPWRQASSSDKD